MVALSPDEIRSAVIAALAEDVGSGDVTTESIVPDTAMAKAVLRARQPLTVAGLAFVETVFGTVSDRVNVNRRVTEGGTMEPGATLADVVGPARVLLTGERVALNYLQRLSGIATLTTRFVHAIRGTPARILDTRKTTPGWRRFEKYAVSCGGGQNHRAGLFDMVLIKDNHLATVRDAQPNPIAAAVRRARQRHPTLKIEVEADTLEQAAQAAAAGADFILLDNMDCDQLRRAVEINAGRCRLEASGGVTLDTVRAIAETGVDFISIGALTHSAVAVDIGMDFED